MNNYTTNKSISVDEAIDRLDVAIKKHRSRDDSEGGRGVLVGPVNSCLEVPPDIGTLDDPQANKIFRHYVEEYIQNGGEPNPSPAILVILRIGAERQVLRERQLGRV